MLTYMQWWTVWTKYDWTNQSALSWGFEFCECFIIIFQLTEALGMIDDYDESSGWMFLLVPAHPGFPGQIPQSRKTVVWVCVKH